MMVEVNVAFIDGFGFRWGVPPISKNYRQYRVMHPFFQGRHYVEAVKKCKFHFLRVLNAAHSSFMQQTPETIFHIRMASCSLVMSEDNPRCIPFAICSELSRKIRSGILRTFPMACFPFF